MPEIVTLPDAYRWGESVLRGKFLACKWMRLMVERHFRDLEIGKDRGFWFSEKAAEHILEFFQAFLHHSKGEWAGKPLLLEPWQAFGLAVQFGWLRDDGYRRFKTSFESTARKTGKSTKTSGVGLYMLDFDDEPGADVYSFATTRDQAEIVWGEAARMVESSPALRTRIKTLRRNLHIAGTASKFEPLGADENTLEGLNTHCGLGDEIHAHRSRAVYDVIETSMGSRRQPMMSCITTAGVERESLCYTLDDYAQKVLEGIFDDDTFFALLCRLDEGDDWRDEAVWSKANPNLGISFKLETMQNACKKAQQMPTYENTFRRYYCNQWTEQYTRWIPMDKWDLCQGKVDASELTGMTCFTGLDLSTTIDITALVLAFDCGSVTRVLPFFWVPEENARERSRKDKVPYVEWIRDGYIEATPGNVVDYDFIRAKIHELSEQYKIQEIAVDAWNATQLSVQLKGDGANIHPFRQGYASMSAPSKDLEGLILSQRLDHGGNPVLRWMASNVAVRMDPAGNIKPAKDESTDRIDGIVALIMAIGCRNLAEIAPDFVYNTRTLYVA